MAIWLKMKNKEYFLPPLLIAVFTVISSIICIFISLPCAAVCFGAGALCTLSVLIYNKKRFSRLYELNSYLEKVCGGDFSLNIQNNTEGELSVLQNNLHKVIRMLSSSNEQLIKDKTFLADSLADISHQLKTPLTSMTVITDLLKDETDPEKRREFIKIIESQCQKMVWLISTLLKLSKLDAGTADFRITPVSSTEFCERCIEPFLITSELKNIEIISDIEPFDFNADSAWSLEAFQNIIKNCIEHTPNGGRINISARSTNLYSEFIIEDNGAGISPDDLPHIFERFDHGKDSDEESVGIGLALAKTVLEKQKATLSAASIPGKGTAFTIKFYKTTV